MCPEDITFPSALKTCLEYLGDPIGCKHAQPPTKRLAVCGYAYLVGTSGEAFALAWAPDWQFSSPIRDLAALEDDKPYRHALDSVGYAGELMRKQPGRDNEALFREQIISSIADKGRPVIGFGIAGPPEAAIITGYDESGDVLIGWSFFQKDPEFAAGLEFEPCGYFRKRDWFPEAEALLILGDKQAERDPGEIVVQALRWNIEVARRPALNGVANGLAAYTAWTEAIAHDELFPTGDEATLRARHFRHDANVGTVAENRWYGACFLIEAADDVHYSLIEDLYIAAGRLAGEHDLMWQVWNAAGGNGNPEAWNKFAEPTVRRQIVPLILEAQAKDADAIAHLEHALSLAERIK